MVVRDAMSRFEAFGRAFHAHFTADPNRRLSLGVERDLGELPDPSAEHEASRVGAARVLLGDAETLAREPLGFDEALDLELAKLALEREVHGATLRFNGRSQAAQLPVAGDVLGNGCFLLFAADPRPAHERLADITARLAATPEYLAALLGRLDVPVERWVAIELAKVSGLPRLFATLAAWAEREAFPGLGELERARARAEQALRDYSTALAAMPTTPAFAVGVAEAERIVRLRGIALSLSELHALAVRAHAENREAVEALRSRLAEKYGLAPGASTREVQDALKRRFRVEKNGPGFGAVLARYEAERARLLAFIRERDLFPIPEDQDMRLLETPSFMAPSIPAGAMLPAAPFRAGTKRSLIYLTLTDALLDEHTTLSIPSMLVHEGIPGHHLQLAMAAGHASLIRRHTEAMDLSEGWATLLEDRMLELGLMDGLTDEARFLGKLDVGRLAPRVAIDLFFMTGERDFLGLGAGADGARAGADAFEAAGALLQAVTGFAPARVEAELNWYSQERGYPLSYLAGNHLAWRLRSELAEAQRGRVEGLALDRLFHRTFLAAGNMPMQHLRRVFERAGLVPSPVP